MDAIDNGRQQGLQVGKWVLDKAEGRTPALASRAGLTE
jgi:hypothetical protein